MSEYAIRRLNTFQFEAKKLDPAGVLVDLYTVDRRIETTKTGSAVAWLCNCPRWTQRRGTKECRHTEFVQKFLDAGEPVPFLVEK